MELGNVLLLCAFMQIIGHSVQCTVYAKHDAMRLGQLSYKAVCRSEKYGFEEKICLNGLKADDNNCKITHCNEFGEKCHSHCLSDDDTVNQVEDYDLKCDPYYELKKLCVYYRLQLSELRKEHWYLSALAGELISYIENETLINYIARTCVEEHPFNLS